MKEIRTLSALALALAIGFTAHAATQGLPSTTSSQATFGITGNGPATPRQVQVLNVTDVSFSNSTRAETNATDPGATMSFCVIDTCGGQVRLSVSTSNNANGSSTHPWRIVTTDNQFQLYKFVVTKAVVSSVIGLASPGSSTLTATVPVDSVVTSSASCGSGNVKAHIELGSPMPESLPARAYTDTITVIATPI